MLRVFFHPNTFEQFEPSSYLYCDCDGGEEVVGGSELELESLLVPRPRLKCISAQVAHFPFKGKGMTQYYRIHVFKIVW